MKSESAHNETETQIIKSLIKNVMSAISKTPMGLADYTVGIEPSVEELTNLLDPKSNEVRVLGLYGMGGIGKTTLAKALSNKLVGHGFIRRSFISNAREICAREGGLESLQNKLENDLGMNYEGNDGIETVKDRKALVVLDDVDNVTQLNALILDKRELFHEGSRIIVTTRDKETLPDHIVNVKYEVKKLDSDKALRLFSYYSLRREKPTDSFLSLSNQIVALTGGLPLALRVFGSFLFDKRGVEEWNDALTRLKKIRPENLHDVLKISYDGLDEEAKCVFLDIACFFVGMIMERDYAVDILKGCNFDAEIAISDLTAKSLIKITPENKIWMHDQIRDMGRQLVKQENRDPFLRSRLWDRREIMNVLENVERNRYTQGIVLDFVGKKRFVQDVDGGRIAWNNFQRRKNLNNAITYVKERYKQYQEDKEERKRNEVKIQAKVLGTMTDLRLLQVNYVKLEGNFTFPADLRWLQWKECPLKYLKSDICAKGLVVLDLSDSKIERVWSRYSNKVAENLKVLNLSGCSNLISVPKLSGNLKLEKLFLRNCLSLMKVDESMGNVNTLIHLDLKGCSSFIKLPSDVSGWRCVKYLALSGCLEFKELPENIGDMRSLKELLVDETGIEMLPESIFCLSELEKLNLNRCKSLKRLPHCIGKLCSLTELSLDASGLEELPDSIGSLENLMKLSVMWCLSLYVLPDSIGNLKLLMEFFVLATPIRELPDCIGLLPNLRSVSIGKGESLCSLPSSIGGLNSLVELQINETSITYLPDEIGSLKSLKELQLWKCCSLLALPESIGDMLSLTTLIIFEGEMRELPGSICKLENLIELRLNKCKELRKLPNSIGDMKSLCRLFLQDTAVTELPESFGTLSNLFVLQLSKKPQIGDTDECKALLTKTRFFPKSFSNLSFLYELNVRSRKITGEIPDDFEKLASLESLNLGYNHFSRLPASLRGLSILTELILPNCRELKSLPPLPSSLLKVDVANCVALENISDLSNLESLEELNLSNCERVEDIPGLECLKSLKRLFMICCDTCSLVTKRRLAKAPFRKIRNLSMPGSKIPDWFTQDVVKFKERRNRPIKGITIGVVVSLDHQIEDCHRNSFPGIVDIQAQILKQDFLVFTTAFNLSGVPNRSDDQVHLCRYSTNTPLVSNLKDGFKIVVRQRNPPHMKGIELKKWGVHLIYEGDDDYEGSEESLNESQQSISERLAKFFSTYTEDGHVSECL